MRGRRSATLKAFAGLRPGRRLAVAYVATAVVASLVVAVGVSMQPVYGVQAPWGGTAFDDVRAVPVSRGWSVDLAKALKPAAAPSCVDLVDHPLGDGRVLVTTQSAQQLDGDATTCTSLDDAGGATGVALFDPVSGRVDWTRRFDHGVVSEVVPTPDRREVVVELVDQGTDYVTLDVETGASVRDVGSLSARSTVFGLVSSPSPHGSLVLTATSQAGAQTPVRLVSTSDLGQTLWQGDIDPSTPPLLFDDGLIAVRDGKSVRVDAKTGRLHEFGGGNVDLADATVEDDVVYAHYLDEDGVASEALSAWTSTGRLLWTSGTGIDMVSAVTRTCLIVTPVAVAGNECLSRKTGKLLWKGAAELPGFLSMPEGTTSNLFARENPQSSVLELASTEMIDDTTGRLAYRLQGRLSQVGWTGASVGYSPTVRPDAATGGAVARQGLLAFDLATGRQLWSFTPKQGSATFWSGHLVTVHDGVVTGYRDPTSSSRTAMGPA